MWLNTSDFDRMFGPRDLFASNLHRLFMDLDKPSGADYGWNLEEATPRTNLYDRGNHLELIAEVPGMDKNDLNVKIQGNYLEISGTRKSDAPQNYKAHRIERQASSFTRSFTLMADIDVAKVVASVKNGILSLTLPKAEDAKPKQITIS